ncbi:hypothetical protein Droror1_Dr00022295 [Drosera rotundifolia]
MIFSRFNFYPRCPLPDQVLGIKPHTDGPALTILLQNKEVEGLQVLEDDQWFKVPVIPDALFINVGDQCEIMSNGVFNSPVHRVVTNSERERVSMAMFCTPDPENKIGPVAELINDGQPQLYRNVKNYPTIFYHYYQLGENSGLNFALVLPRRGLIFACYGSKCIEFLLIRLEYFTGTSDCCHFPV